MDVAKHKKRWNSEHKSLITLGDERKLSNIIRVENSQQVPMVAKSKEINSECEVIHVQIIEVDEKLLLLSF